MDLTWLEDFAALAETGNFSRAAAIRNCTQPAFSRRIRALEEWVGTPLFDRGVTPVALTPAGEHFRPAAIDSWRRLMQARTDAREAADDAAAQVVVAATHALSLLFFPAWLKRLETLGPVAPVRLVSDSLQACEELMAQGGAQFLLCHRHPQVADGLHHAAFRTANIGTDVLVPVAAPGLVSGLSGPLPYLAYSPQSGMGRILAAQLRLRPPLDLRPVFTSHLSAVLRTMAGDGRGLAWLPRSLVEGDLATGRLVHVGGQEWDVTVDIVLIRPRPRQSPAAEAFWSLAAGSC